MAEVAGTNVAAVAGTNVAAVAGIGMTAEVDVAAGTGGSLSNTCCREKGKSPAPRNPPLQCSGLKDVSQSSAINDGKTSLVTFRPFVVTLYFFKIFLQVLFRGANAPTSSGCSKWVVFGGKQRIMILSSRASLISSKLM